MRAWRVTVAAADEDLAAAALWEAGTAGVEVCPRSGDRVDLLAYFEDDAPSPVPALLPLRAAVEPADVPDVDWVARFREGFRSFRVGRFVVAPPWEATEAPSAADLLVVDPGRAFGTGTHETTRLCLGALEDLACRRPLGRTLDLGAGTGLLAIAAARLGAFPVVASDLDPEATASSRHHAHPALGTSDPARHGPARRSAFATRGATGPCPRGRAPEASSRAARGACAARE